MIVKELIELLQKEDQNLDVVFDYQSDSHHQYFVPEISKEICFIDKDGYYDPEKPLKGKTQNVIVISGCDFAREDIENAR
jgi:hypothetical protein